MDDEKQALLFPVITTAKTARENLTIQERFEEFHRLNPWVYRELLNLIEEWIAFGDEKIGIKALCEELRWHVKRKTEGRESFKINNNYTSRYARLIMDNVKALDGIFFVRELKAE